MLSAVDAAIMVLDAAKGIETQTLKLFEVCRARNMPIITFINKWDRPSLDPLELIDQIEQAIGVQTTPMTWPVGPGGEFEGVINRHTKQFIRYTRTSRGATEAIEETLDLNEINQIESTYLQNALEEVELLDEIGATHDQELFLAGETSPLFVGSALTNFGVRHLLDAVVNFAPLHQSVKPIVGHCAILIPPSLPLCSKFRRIWTHRIEIGLRLCESIRIL